MADGQKLYTYLSGTKIFCKNQRSYNAVDSEGTHANTAGRYCREHERRPSWVGELLSLQEFQRSIEQGEDACRRTPANTPDETAQGQGSWHRHWPIPEPTALYALWVIQSSDNSGLEISVCLGVKNIGKPCAGKLHARFDEGGQASACFLLYP